MSDSPTSDRTGCSLLPVAIMAHNEEKTIEKAVTSALTQEFPDGFYVKVLVVANGCNDHTEEVVRSLAERYPNTVQLLSISEKGKTRAINRAISHLEVLSQGSVDIPYVVFLDADCRFVGNYALSAFVRHFDETPGLLAVGADCVPDVLFNSRSDVVAKMYRATYELSRWVRVNAISGMCYAIRFDALKRIDFPEFQFAEDMFISARLDGRFLTDRSIQIAFGTPVNLGSELRRRTRQEVSTLRYHRYYSYLREKQGTVRLADTPLGEEFRWWGPADNRLLSSWLRVPGLMKKALLMGNMWLRVYAKIAARMKFRALRGMPGADYWLVDR